jgi:hypothetical protein
MDARAVIAEFALHRFNGGLNVLRQRRRARRNEQNTRFASPLAVYRKVVRKI